MPRDVIYMPFLQNYALKSEPPGDDIAKEPCWEEIRLWDGASCMGDVPSYSMEGGLRPILPD